MIKSPVALCYIQCVTSSPSFAKSCLNTKSSLLSWRSPLLWLPQPKKLPHPRIRKPKKGQPFSILRLTIPDITTAKLWLHTLTLPLPMLHLHWFPPLMPVFMPLNLTSSTLLPSNTSLPPPRTHTPPLTISTPLL